MNVICHRGLWKTPEEKNSLDAFARAFRLGCGVETDVRDCAGQLVISHDPPAASATPLIKLLHLHSEYGGIGTLALNVKSDGLLSPLQQILEQFPAADAFVFDMSVPDTLPYLTGPIPVFTRQSEYEPSCAFYAESAGVWLDAFQTDWYDESLICRHLAAGKKVCIVSPELHKRPFADLWARLRDSGLHDARGLMICTDFPEQALAAFYGAARPQVEPS